MMNDAPITPTADVSGPSPAPAAKGSYHQIFKSTALVGGAQVACQVINILRAKALAVLLGPAGVGVVGLYTTATALVGTIAGFGLNSSGVRQISQAAASNDTLKIARTIVTLRRVALVSGVIGMLAVLALARPLSQSTFGNADHTWGMALMSLTLLFAGVNVGQLALLQGLRRLRELALAQVIGIAFGAVVSVGLVFWLREQGIVPFLVATSAFAVLLSWWFARQISVEEVRLTMRELLVEARGLLGIGLAFTVSALLASLVAYLSRVLVQRELGLDAVGLYQATWQLSSQYVGFVLAAMGADFLPRLTAAAGDRLTLNRLVNEQAEMGILIAVPGVLATLALAPWVLQAFYSSQFTAAADVARWQIIGIFLRVVSWPLGYALIAKGRMVIWVTTELVAALLHVALILVCMQNWGLEGIGIAFAVMYVLYTGLMLGVCRWLTGFRWSSRSVKILLPSVLALAAVFLAIRLLPAPWGMVVGLGITVVVGMGCLRGLEKLLGMHPLDILKRRLGLAKVAA